MITRNFPLGRAGMFAEGAACAGVIATAEIMTHEFKNIPGLGRDNPSKHTTGVPVHWISTTEECIVVK